MAHCKNDELEILGLGVLASPEILLLCCVLSLYPVLGTDSIHETV